MRRFLSLFTMLMLCGVVAFAQSRVVSGRITDSDGNPVPFATVKIEGSKTGLSADANGSYSIKVKNGDVLEISSAGFKTTQLAVGSLTTVNIVMEKGTTGELKEVVVTGAFGTRRTARSTASNVQNVNSEQLNTVRQTNVNNALAGKVAGIQVRSNSGATLGRETIVRLRGENGVGIGGGALYVVDGTIIPSANDINVDDIEDVTVLQGPAAAALFGPDASNGAIVVNTKKARRSNQRGLGIEINSGITFDKAYILPDYQNEYGGGTNYYGGVSIADMGQYKWKAGDPVAWKALDGKYYPDYTEDVSWGPRMAGQEYIPWYAWYGGHERSYKTASFTNQPNNARDFFNTGVTKQNNISFSKGGEGYNFRASYTNVDQKGLIPNSYLQKHQFNINGTLDIGSRFTVGINFNYISQRTQSENDDTYANATSGSFNQWFHRDLDINIMRELQYLRGPNGELATWNHNNPEAYNAADNGHSFYTAFYWHSPYAWQNNTYNFVNRDRLFGDASLTYKANNDLKFKFTYRKQQLTSNADIRQYYALDQSAGTNSGFSYWEVVNGRAKPYGGYQVGYNVSNRQNYEFLGTYNKKIKSFQVNVNVGVDIFKATQSTFNANTMGGLFVPDKFILSNSKNTVNQANTITNLNRRSVFANAFVGFRNYLFLEGTFRRDYISSEAQGNYIDTKSGGLSFVFSDLINRGGRTTFLSYGKIRGSMGQILNALTAYQNNTVYTINPLTYNGNLLLTEPNALVDPLLHGAANLEKEVGLELRFWKNRIGLNATYWGRTNKDFPINATVYGGTGYGTIQTNAGEVKKTGIDLQLFLNPVKMKNFDWTVNATWGKLIKNDVISINNKLGIVRQTTEAGGNGNINLVSEVGQRWGQLRGTAIKRINGQPVLRADGIYERELNVNFGSSLPDYTGGVQNTFTIFKNFTLNINIDYSVGGKYFSLSDYYGSSTGLYNNSTGLNDKGIPVRDLVANGGGTHVFGVDATGKPVDYYVETRYFWEQNGLYSQGIAETAIRDLGFVKLRELGLGYTLPMAKLGIGKYVKTAVFTILARNPWLIYAKGGKGFDPSELSDNSGETGALPGTRGLGINLKLGF